MYRGVNALASGQVIKFSEQLTVLFGQNGSGKTGYSRIIKHAAKSRTHEPILGNVESSATQREPQAVFEIKVNDLPETIEWRNEAGVEHLDRIAVFDSSTAVVHVNEDLDYEFTPAELARFDDVTQALQEVQERIAERASDLRAQSQLPLNPFTPGSVVRQLVERISAETPLDKIRQLAVVTPTERDELQGKKREHAELTSGTDGARALQLQQQSQEIGEVTEVILALAAFDPDAYNAALADAGEAQSAVAELQSTLRSAAVPGAPLGAPGERFIRAGAEYASHLGLTEYPVEDSKCLYCGQSLGAEALAFIRSYGAFLTSAAQAQYEAAEEALTATLPQLDEERLQLPADRPSAFPELPDSLAAAATLREEARSALLQTAGRQACSGGEVCNRANSCCRSLRRCEWRSRQREAYLVSKRRAVLRRSPSWPPRSGTSRTGSSSRTICQTLSDASTTPRLRRLSLVATR